MLEIIIIILVAIKVANICKEKGYKPAGFVIIFIVSWLFGEFLGAFIGAFITTGLGLYVFALLGAALGATLSYTIINNMKAKETVGDTDILDQKL